jgi:hypothetical protein
MVKVELHTHTADDPVDRIPYTTTDLIDRAGRLGYGALAITLHERQLELGSLIPYAADRGVVLIRGIERSIEGRHVLLLNFDRRAEDVETFADLARLRQQQPGLVIAPHPYYPSRTSLLGRLDRHADLFDAVEYNAMFTASVNVFNERAERFAARHGKPVVGNGDVHRIGQLGSTYSLVDAAPEADAICQAIAAGRVRVESRPLSWMEVAAILPDMMVSGIVPRLPRRAQAAKRSVGPVSPEPAECGDGVKG